MTNQEQIRPYEHVDEAAVAAVWYRAGKLAYPYLPAWRDMTPDLASQVFRDVIASSCTLWVATRDGRIVAYLAMNKSYIDRLYVDPSEQRKRWGRRLIAHAKSLHPEGLELHTHQENHAARAFYEREGFSAVRFGVSPPPESAPDVEYHWRPDNGAR
jgi:ribosomal protein S18 acetylase RimI-like enzyme